MSTRLSNPKSKATYSFCTAHEWWLNILKLWIRTKWWCFCCVSMCPRKMICELRIIQWPHRELPVVSLWFGSRHKHPVFLTGSLKRRKSFLRKTKRWGKGKRSCALWVRESFQKSKQTIEEEDIAQSWGPKDIIVLRYKGIIQLKNKDEGQNVEISYTCWHCVQWPSAVKLFFFRFQNW